MALILNKTWQGLHFINEEYAHPRTRDWFLISSPVPVILIIAGYLYFCLNLGPRFMKNRPPFELKYTLIFYNIVQIFLSIFLFYEGGVNAWFSHYNFNCQPIDYTDNDPREIRLSEIVWWYYFCKIIELLDTVFFVLRKKEKQISSLHIYHHTIMPLVSWIGVKFVPGGHCTLLGWINAFVHIIMYSYYLVAGLGPQYQKYLWWKKHLTLLQLIQFVIIFWHNFSVLFRDCAFPKICNFASAIESIVFMYMFGNFYYKSYVKDSKRKKHE